MTLTTPSAKRVVPDQTADALPMQTITRARSQFSSMLVVAVVVMVEPIRHNITTVLPVTRAPGITKRQGDLMLSSRKRIPSKVPMLLVEGRRRRRRSK